MTPESQERTELRGRLGRAEIRSVSSRGVSRLVTRVMGAALLLAALAACGREGELEEPTPLYGEVPVEYPLDLWDADVEGQTLLRVRVTDRGSVDSVEVLESSGYPAFDSAAVAGARQLRYSPARRDGQRLTVWAKVPVQFSKDPS